MQEQRKKEEKEQQQQPPAAADVYSILEFTIGALSSLAWQLLGLRVNPQTQTITKDLQQAKLAIDCMDYLFTQIKHKFNDQEKRAINTLLTDLKLNYLEQLKIEQKPNKESEK